MAQESVVFLVGAVAMLAGTALFGFWGVSRATDDTRVYYGLLTAVAAVSTVAYAAMALGIDSTTVVGRRHAAHLARYADWLVTTPLLLAALVRLAAAGRRLLAALTVLAAAFAAALAAAAVVTAGIAGLSLDQTWLALWGVAVVLLLALLAVVLRVLSPRAGRRHRRNPDVAVLFSILRNVLVVALLLYPVVWLVAPTGLGVVGSLVAAAAYLVVDLLAKLAFGVLLLRDPGTLAAAAD